MKKLILFLFLSSLTFAQRPYTIRTAYLPEVDYAAILFQPVVTTSGRLQTASGTLSGACSPNGSIRYDGANTGKLCVSGTWTALATGSSGANTALSNLAAVSINASLTPQTTLNLGAQATPWKEIWFYGSGTFASHSFKLTGTPTGHRVITFPDASITVARTDAAQTFTGNQTFTGAILGQGQLDGANGNFSVNGSTGGIVTAAGLQMGSSSSFYWGSRSIITSPADGNIKISDFNGTDFGRLQLGGTTSSYPSIKRSNAALEVRLADDSAYGDIKVRTYLADSTITAGGTTGNQTINKSVGTVNIAAAGTTVTVTNSLVTTSSIVLAVIRTNDSTATLKNVVPGSGSFVITLTAAATAEVSIGFVVIN